MVKVFGLVYKITNTINDKVYIGKTKSHYGIKPYGIKGRWAQHKTNHNIPSRKDECRVLYNAMRKYGVKCFEIEEIKRCDLDEYDDYEIELIAFYDSTNDNFGYNISKGGKGRSIAETSDEVRTKISKAQKKNNKYPLGIHEYYRDDKLVGYTVNRKRKGINYRKYFTSTKNTLNKNLDLAKKFIEDIKKGKINNNNKYNRRTNLPQNIVYYKNKKGIIKGYTVYAMINGEKYCKQFIKSELSMEKKLQLALKYKKQLLDN
jgi:group I intron endonuclease